MLPCGMRLGGFLGALDFERTAFTRDGCSSDEVPAEAPLEF